MKSHHVVTLSLALGALALMISGLDRWADALRPQFVGGALAAIAAVLKGMYQSSPAETPTLQIVRASRDPQGKE